MNVRKRGLALLMCICMIFTLLPFSAFADGTSEPDVVYGKYDNGTWTQDDNAKDTVTRKTEGDNTLSLTKTAKRTADNTYDITLKVVSTQTETTTKPGSAATVLVMDVSGSMDICATCNNSEQHSDWDGNYWYEHSENCKIGKTRKVQDSETRLKAAKDAAYDFILSYSGAVLEDGQVTGLKDNAADGLGRYVSVVSFSTDSSVACEWKDVSTADGYNAVKAAIDGLKADGGTNLDAGLQTANTQLSKTTVASIKANAKNVIALTDGMPTFYVGGDGKNGNHGSYGCPDTNEATAKSATALKASASVYTVCFGASEDKCWEKDSEHNWEQKWHPIFGLTWVASEWHKTAGPTVGDFLSGSIATPAAGGKTYAYNADNTTELMTAFKAITSSITEGIKTGTVLDPMGDHITVTSRPDNFVETDKGYKWELSNPTVATDGGKTTYTYELTYTVTFDPNFGDFDENSYYAANKQTTFTAGGKVYNFNVPGVKGTAPRYNVTYKFEGTCPDSVAVPASEQHKAGDTVTMPEITAPEGWIFNGWKYDSEPVTSVEMPASDITIIGTFTERKAYTVKYLLNGTDISVKDADTGTKNVGESVEATAPDLPGYTFAGTDADKNQTITVASDVSQNVITFYYYKNVTVTAKNDTKVYGNDDSAAFGATVTGTRDNETVVYTVGRQAGEDVGNYAITPTGDKIQGYYKVEYKTGSFEITARPVTLTGESAARTYTGKEIELTGITPDGLLDGHNLSGVSYSAKGTDARTEPYPGTFSNTENIVIKDAAGKNVTNNYNVEYKPGALTINPIGTVTVTIKGNTDSKVYNGIEQSVTGYTVKISDPKYTEADFKFTGDPKASRTDVGTTYMGLKAEQFENKNSNFDKVTFVIENDGYVEVTPRPVTLTSETASKTYDGTPLTKPEVTVTGDGFVDGEVTDIKATGSVTNVSDSPVTNTIVYTTTDKFVEDNYNITKAEGKLSITPLAVTVTAKDYTKYVGEKDPAFEATVTGTINNDTVSYTISREAGETVGTYPITPAGAEAQGNYTVTYKAGTLTIKERPYRPNPSITDKITVEITGNSDSVVYDGTEHSVKDYTVKISDSRYTEKDFTFSGKALASGINAGAYEMGLKADQFKNTNARFKNVEFIIKADGVLTITQRPLTITAGSAEGIAPVTCDKYTVEGLATGDKVDSVKITGIQSEPGESPNVASDAVIKNAKGEDVTANYKITYVDGVLKAIEVLNKEIHFNYVIGYTDGTIRPNNDISRAEVATIFFRLLTDEAREQYTTTAGNFTDVKAGMWCNRAIATLTNMGIIKGYTDGSFQPNKSITRAELATIIARFAKLDVNTKTFSDITGHWAQKNIELAAGNGWINGYTDGTFRPNKSIIRAETFAMINRVLDRQTESVSDLLPTSDMNMWSDNLNENAWYYKDVQEATNYHKCDRVGDSVYEKWTEKVPDIDWASYQI